MIENNVLLKQLTVRFEEFQKKQDANHLVAVALADHNTIIKVEQLWTGFGNLRFLMWMVGGILGGISVLFGALAVTHLIWNWP